MFEIIPITACVARLMSKTELKRLRAIVLAMLSMTGRVTMVGLSRWTEGGGSYRTIQRWFNSRMEWGALLWAVVEAHVVGRGGTYVLAVDEVVVSKAGKMTAGVGRFYSSMAGRPISAVSFVAASLVDIGARRSYPVQVEQRLLAAKAPAVGAAVKRGRGRPKGSKNHARSAPVLSAELMVLDGLLGTLLKRIGVLQVRHLVMDGFFGNYPTTWLVGQHGLHLISKLRHNAVLCFPYTGAKPRRGPTPRYGNRLDYTALPPAACWSAKAAL